MKKRINNDIKISWAILRNGQPEDFTDATNIKVKAVMTNSYAPEVPYERIGNLFHIAIPAETLKLGTYHLVLSYNKPDVAFESGVATISIDQKNAFEVVKHTAEESDDGRDITGNIVVVGIPSGGTEGQYLAKVNGTSYNTEWKSPEQSTGISTINIMSQKAITDALDLKVDKVTGKGLSTNDYTDADVDEVAKIAGKQDALGFTPENVANKKTSITDSDTDYPSGKAVKTFVEAAVAQKSFYADTMTVNSGTLNQGTVADLDEVGGTDVIIDELVGADPLTVTFDFSDVTEVTSFVFYGEYVGGAMHQVYIEVYNYVSLAWDLKLIIGTEGSKKWYTAPIYNSNAYLSEGAMQVRFRHISNGISSHQLILDYIEINSGGSGGQTNISASSVNFLPTGNIEATNVASALAELDTEKVATSLVGAVSGLAQLDSTGKHKIEQYQDIILGQLKYGGTFDNDGLITSDYSTLNGQDIDLLLATDWKGFFFIFSGTTSTHHSIEFESGDWLISNGTAGWAKIDNTDAVTLVNGKKGNVTLVTDDISEGATPTNKWFTEARVRASVLTGLSATNSAIAATDTVLQGFNKAQGQISDIITKINASGLTANYLPRWDGSKLVNSVVSEVSNVVTINKGNLTIISPDADGAGQLTLGAKAYVGSIAGKTETGATWWQIRNYTGLLRFGSDVGTALQFYTGGITNVRMDISSGGNVGIGYTDRSEKFAVNGSGYFNGALTINGGLITFGANDSAGAGYRILRVPNI